MQLHRRVRAKATEPPQAAAKPPGGGRAASGVYRFHVLPKKVSAWMRTIGTAITARVGTFCWFFAVLPMPPLVAYLVAGGRGGR